MRTIAIFLTFCGLACAQEPNPTQKLANQSPNGPMPIFRVTVVSRTVKAINYHHRMGSTNVDFRGTELMPEARGDARVDSRTGATKLDVHTSHMQPAQKYGPEYLTYVLWAVTPEGRANNLGELVVDGDHSNLLATTELQAFGLIVTAEPYYAVTQPSDVVVMENFIRTDTTGTIEEVDAKYELLKRGQYVMNVTPDSLAYRDRSVPLQLQEARNAMAIARAVGAENYAADTLQKGLIDLQNAEGYYRSRGSKKSLETTAREATQMAEDARIITLRKLDEEHLAQERAAAAEREARAKAQAQQADQQRVQAEQQAQEQTRLKLQAEAESQRLSQQRAAAEQAKREAEEAAQRASQERAQAEAARAAALQQQQQAEAETERARSAAREADAARVKAETDKEEMRQRLLQQLNLILETRDSARGLIVNMSDVLFDFNKATLKPGAREKLAKVAGIVLAYPGLRLALEGHTDSIGSDEYNMTLSQKRAESVREYLISQAVPTASITAQGFGKADPVASNASAAGRQRNRRVEMVVSGEVIGTQIAPLRTPPVSPQP